MRQLVARLLLVYTHRTQRPVTAGRLTDRGSAAGDPPTSARVLDEVRAHQGHNTPLPLERSAPASCKRVLGGGLLLGGLRLHTDGPNDGQYECLARGIVSCPEDS